MSVVIERADESQLRDLVRLTAEFWSEVAYCASLNGFEPDTGKIEAELLEFLDMPDYAVLMATTPKGHPLGFVSVFQMEVQLREEPYAILDKLYVRPDYRRRKIAHQLVEQAKFFARSRKCKRLQSTFPAHFELPLALAFFRAERFYETGGRKHKVAI